MSKKGFWAATFAVLLFFAMGMASRSAAEWTIQAVDAPKYFAEFFQRAIEIDHNGHPRIAYGGDHLYYTYHDGSRWQYETADPSPRVGRYASIALDGSGKAHISYFDGTNYALKYATNRSGSWQSFTVDSAGGVGQYTFYFGCDMAMNGSLDMDRLYYDRVEVKITP